MSLNQFHLLAVGNVVSFMLGESVTSLKLHSMNQGKRRLCFDVVAGEAPAMGTVLDIAGVECRLVHIGRRLNFTPSQTDQDMPLNERGSVCRIVQRNLSSMGNTPHRSLPGLPK